MIINFGIKSIDFLVLFMLLLIDGFLCGVIIFSHAVARVRDSKA